MTIEYAVPCTDYIDAVVDDTMREDLYDSLYNLSCLLGDINGQLSKATCLRLISNFRVKSPGIITSVLNTNVTSDQYSADLPVESFITVMPYSTYVLYNEIYNLNSSLVVTSDELGADQLTSPLMQEGIVPVNSDLESALFSLYLSLYDLYLQLSSYKTGYYISFSVSDIKNIESNASWISYNLDGFENYDFITMIRHIQRLLSFVYNKKFLFA
jgi:hypothetical protein